MYSTKWRFQGIHAKLKDVNYIFLTCWCETATEIKTSLKSKQVKLKDWWFPLKKKKGNLSSGFNSLGKPLLPVVPFHFSVSLRRTPPPPPPVDLRALPLCSPNHTGYFCYGTYHTVLWSSASMADFLWCEVFETKVYLICLENLFILKS